LQVEGVGKRFGGFVALDGIDVAVREGERVGLIGPNGSGKSTLVNCLCGTFRHEQGSVQFAGRRIDGLAAHQRTRLGIARSFQLPRPFATLTVAENLLIPMLYAGPVVTREAAEALSTRILDQLELAGKATQPPAQLTQIEMRKLELARALAARPKLLIADEPMAGLSNAEVDEVLDLLLRLNAEGITIVLIEHIMRAVLRFSQRLIVLVAGRKIADGDPQLVIRDPDVVRAYLGE
jgi:branched-chain amino acid transport system ATP-binding protein